VKTYVVNKCGKFCVKIFLHYIDIAIFALGYFILPHPIYRGVQANILGERSYMQAADVVKPVRSA